MLITAVALFGFFPGKSFGQIIYQHDFGTTAISSHPYTGAPAVIDANLSLSSWTNSESAWSSGAGSAGEAIQLNSTPNGTTITLDLTVNPGYQASISGFSFGGRAVQVALPTGQ
jgi:hypothetical protein